MRVGSALGYVPLAAAPIYSATKAAVHSFTISPRRHLKNSAVRVIEIISPVVKTDLHRGQARKPPGALSLDAFIHHRLVIFDINDIDLTCNLEVPTGLLGNFDPQVFLDLNLVFPVLY